MRAVKFLALAALAITLSGCGGTRRAEMKRLQSQVGLLDERITQLERTSFSAASTDYSSGAGA